MVIQHNMLANFSKRQLGINSSNKAKSAEKLGSGYRINRAADDAAGLAISEKMRAQIRGLNQSDQNIQDGVSLLQTADGAMNEVHDILQRMRELSVQSATDTYTDEDRESLNQEFNQLRKEINRISRQTEFNTQKILFDNTVSVGGTPSDIEIYTDNAGDYAGIVFQGVRYDWSNFPSETGGSSLDSAIPKEGEYFLDTVSGTRLHFSMDKGKELPNISKKYDIIADESSIQIDNYSYNWSHVYDEDGYPIDMTNPKEGNYLLDHCGSKIGFYVDDGDIIEDVIAKLNASGAGALSSWESEIDMKAIQPAVYNLGLKTPVIDINNMNKNYMVEGSYTIHADATGIQINNYTKVGWNELDFLPPYYNGETKGIDFSTGKGIGDGTNITFQCPDTGISFSFNIHGEASLNEAINGLNNAPIPSHIDADVQAQFVLDTTTSVMSGANINNITGLNIDFDTQRDELGLDYDTDSYVAANSLSGLNIAYAGASFGLDSTQMNNLDSFFRYGYSNSLQLTFNHSTTERITINFMRANNMTDSTRPDALSYVNPVDYQTALNTYVTEKITDFTTQFTNSSFSIKSDQASINIGTIHGINIEDGNRSSLFLFDVKPKVEIPIHVQAGANKEQSISMYLGKIGSAKLGIGDEGIRTRAGASANILVLDSAIELVSRYRSKVGAYQNRLEHAQNNVENSSENLQDSESKIRDVDMAEEMISYAKHNILEQVSQSMLAQANQSTQGIMDLLS